MADGRTLAIRCAYLGVTGLSCCESVANDTLRGSGASGSCTTTLAIEVPKRGAVAGLTCVRGVHGQKCCRKCERLVPEQLPKVTKRPKGGGQHRWVATIAKSHPGRKYGCLLNNSGLSLCQAFIAGNGVLLFNADCKSCWL